MAITAVPLSRADAGRTAAVLARAFQDDPMMTFLTPDPGRRSRLLPGMFGAIQRDCLHHGRVTTTSDLAGVACWLRPGRTDPGPARMLRSGLMVTSLPLGAGGLRRLFGLTGRMTAGHHRVMAGPHWYLWLLGTEPDRVGRGIAGAVLAPTLAEADAAGLPCYLDTHLERNLGFYARHGFTPVLAEEYAGLRYWGLRRDPR